MWGQVETVFYILKYIVDPLINTFKTKIPIICRANQWTGLYVVGTYVMKELNNKNLQ